MNIGRLLFLLAIGSCLAACAATNPNSEIMVDTSAHSERVLPGESPRTVQPSQMGQPSAIPPVDQ
jgi:hypothetical protein